MPPAEEREMQPCNAFGWGEGDAAHSPCPRRQSLLIARWLSLPAAMLPPAHCTAQLPPASPLKGSRALMTSHALTSNRYVFENRIRPHTSMTTLKGFSPHLLLSVLYTQVEEWHKAPLSPPFSPSSSRQQENLRRAKGKLKKQFWILSAQGTISTSGFCCC